MPQHPILTGILRRCRKEEDSVWERYHQQQQQQQQQHPEPQRDPQHQLQHQQQEQHQLQHLVHARLSYPLSSYSGGRIPRSSWVNAAVQHSRVSSNLPSRGSSDSVNPCAGYARPTHVSCAACEAPCPAAASAAGASAAAAAPAAAIETWRGGVGDALAIPESSRCCEPSTTAGERLSYARGGSAAAVTPYLLGSSSAGAPAATAGSALRTATAAAREVVQPATAPQDFVSLASSICNGVTAAARSHLTGATRTSDCSFVDERVVDPFLDACPPSCNSLSAPAPAAAPPAAALPAATAAAAPVADASFTTPSAAGAAAGPAAASSCVSGAFSAAVHPPPATASAARTAAAPLDSGASPCLSLWQAAAADVMDLRVSANAEPSSAARLSTDAFRLSNEGVGPGYRLSSSVVPSFSGRAPSSLPFSSSLSGGGATTQTCPSPCPCSYPSSFDACTAANQRPRSSSFLIENVGATSACGASRERSPFRVSVSDCASAVGCTHAWPDRPDPSADSARASFLLASSFSSNYSEGVAAPVPSAAAFSHISSAGATSLLPCRSTSSAAETPTHRQQPRLLPRADAAFSAAVHPPPSAPLHRAQTVNPAFTSSCSVADGSTATGHAAAAAADSRSKCPAADTRRPLAAHAAPAAFALPHAAAPCRQAVAAAAVCHRQPSSAEYLCSLEKTEALSVPAADPTHAPVQQPNTGTLLAGAEVAPRRSDPLYERKRGIHASQQQQRHSAASFYPEHTVEQNCLSSLCKPLSLSSSSSSSVHSYTDVLSSVARSAATRIQHQISCCGQHIAGGSQQRGSASAAAAAPSHVNNIHEDFSSARMLKGTAESFECLQDTSAACKTSRSEAMQTTVGISFQSDKEHAAGTAWNKDAENMHALVYPDAADERPAARTCSHHMAKTCAPRTTFEKLHTPRRSLQIERCYQPASSHLPPSTDLHLREASAPGLHTVPPAGGALCSTEMHAAASTCLLGAVHAEAASCFCSRSSYAEAARGAPGGGRPRREEDLADLEGAEVGFATEGFYAEKADGTRYADVERAAAASRLCREESEANRSLPNKTLCVAQDFDVKEVPAEEMSVSIPMHADRSRPGVAAAAQKTREMCTSLSPCCSQPPVNSCRSASKSQFSEAFQDGTQVVVPLGYTQHQQHFPSPQRRVAAPHAAKVAACGSLPQHCCATTPARRRPGVQPDRLGASVVAVASLADCDAPRASRTPAALSATAALPSAAAAQAGPCCAALAPEKAEVKCCLPPSLRNRFRVLKQVGKGMYGDVFVCAFRQPAATTSAAASPEKQPQQQNAQHSASAQQQGQQQYAPQSQRQQQQFDQQRECHSDHHSDQGRQHSQQQQLLQHRLGVHQGPQQDQTFVHYDGKAHQEKEVKDVEMTSTEGSTSAGYVFPISQSASEFLQSEVHRRLGAPAAPAAPDGVAAGAATETAGAAAVVTGAAGVAVAGCKASLATGPPSLGCAHSKSSRSGEAAAAAGGAVGLSAECEEFLSGEEQRLRYGEEEQQLQRERRQQAQGIREKEDDEEFCSYEEQHLFAMKRVRLPTSKLKAIFGIEQQVLREITLLRTLRHVNILRLHAFHFELEQWERWPSAASRRHQPDTLLQQQHQQQSVQPDDGREERQQHQQQQNGKESGRTPQTQQHAVGSLAFGRPAPPPPPLAPAAADAGAAAARQEAAAPQEGVRAEQMYRPTFYLFFELCDCDLAQIIDETYEKFLQFWKKEVKEAAAAKAVEPSAIIQQLVQTSLETIPRPGFDEEETQLIAYQLFQAIAYCHARDVMHRDIKPQNIMMLLDREAPVKFPWVVKLGDFGLACHAYTRDACRTKEVVTLLYRPPELLMGCNDYTTAVDVWSAGIVVAEMILGRPPFRGRSSEADLLSRMQQWLGSPTSAELQRFCAQPAALAEILKKREPLLPAAATRESRLRLLLTDQFDRQLLSNLGIHFLATVLQTDPELRPSAVEALQHPWLRSVLEKFGNRGVYLHPSDITLPPDFLAVDPINYSFYFSPIQLKRSPEFDNGQGEGEQNMERKKRPLIMPWDHPPQGHYNRFDQIRRPHLIPRLDVDTVISIYRKAGIFSDEPED